jgi:hypothetical protein
MFIIMRFERISYFILQLTRARQCPYFYVCANSFTCLFRAAGILGFSDIHALLTPTTRGFRHMLKDEGSFAVMDKNVNFT